MNHLRNRQNVYTPACCDNELSCSRRCIQKAGDTGIKSRIQKLKDFYYVIVAFEWDS